MTIQTQAGGPSIEERSCADPEQILAVLDQALATPGATVLKLRLVRHLLDAGDSVDTYSDAAIAGLLACSERTAWDARQWVSQLFANSQLFATMHVSRV